MKRYAVALFALYAVLAVAQTSCLPRSAVRSASDLAADLCRDYYAERVGISWEDAGRKFCETHEDLKPFIDLLLSQKATLDESPVGARAKAAK